MRIAPPLPPPPFSVLVTLDCTCGAPFADKAPPTTTLVQIPLGDEVPEQLYRAVAEVISFAYILAGKMPEHFDPQTREEA